MIRNVNFRHNVRADPAWVIIGIERDRGDVMLLASDQLTQVYMEAEVSTRLASSFFDREVRMMPDTTYTLSTTMGSIYVTIGDTWFDAFAKLFGTWEPRPQTRGQLGAAPRQIPAQSSDG